MEEKYGEVEEMNVCDNLGDHLVGNVYVKVRGAAPDRLAVGVRGCGGGEWRPGSAVILPVVRVQRPRGCRAWVGLLCGFGSLRLDSNETPAARARRRGGSSARAGREAGLGHREFRSLGVDRVAWPVAAPRRRSSPALRPRERAERVVSALSPRFSSAARRTQRRP